ncbi:hypothetical protein K2173_012146 [Erythroxylum novogranatense]|uniref:Uncharacterized protein n=1 Tax=Erythroxylum novogranatense TaxID=1862640 RepID=A0AAV8SR63_9ROSI|nr:hypothetical protein K2173_012146 [Erythroxylum novogranatense]
MAPGISAVQYALKMHGYIERLAVLGFVMDYELSRDLILVGLSDGYSQFVINYQMNQISTTIPELINLLKTAEQAIKKDSKQVLMGLRDSRKLIQGELDLREGNAARVATLAVDTYVLFLPSGLIFKLDD